MVCWFPSTNRNVSKVPSFLRSSFPILVKTVDMHHKLPPPIESIVYSRGQFEAALIEKENFYLSARGVRRSSSLSLSHTRYQKMLVLYPESRGCVEKVPKECQGRCQACLQPIKWLIYQFLAQLGSAAPNRLRK